MGTPDTGSSGRILQMALNLFASKGYDATSIREICEASGITKPTLYHFFGSKDGVFRALVQGALEEFERDVRLAVEPPGSAVERLQRVARGYFDSAVRQRELVRLIFALVHSSSGAPPSVDIPGFYERILKLVAGVMEHGVVTAELQPGPTDVRLLVFMGSLSEAVCGNLITGQPWLTPELADTLVETVVGGWRTGEPRDGGAR
jgi:TetR/AcrR family transcriptional regulator